MDYSSINTLPDFRQISDEAAQKIIKQLGLERKIEMLLHIADTYGIYFTDLNLLHRVVAEYPPFDKLYVIVKHTRTTEMVDYYLTCAMQPAIYDPSWYLGICRRKIAISRSYKKDIRMLTQKIRSPDYRYDIIRELITRCLIDFICKNVDCFTYKNAPINFDTLEFTLHFNNLETVIKLKDDVYNLDDSGIIDDDLLYLLDIAIQQYQDTYTGYSTIFTLLRDLVVLKFDKLACILVERCLLSDADRFYNFINNHYNYSYGEESYIIKRKNLFIVLFMNNVLDISRISNSSIILIHEERKKYINEFKNINNQTHYLVSNVANIVCDYIMY